MIIDIVLFDLDGTLSESSARAHLAVSKQWDAFNAAAVNDPPREAEAALARGMFRLGYRILILTGRSDQYQLATLAWLQKWDIRYHELRMRPAASQVPDVVLKPSLLTREELNRVLCVFEDRDGMVAAWRALGLTCFQVQPGSY